MTIISTMRHGVKDVFPQFLDGLRSEFDCADVGAIGEIFLAAEAADFHWESRVVERHLGLYSRLDEDEEELDRVLVLGFLGGRWHVTVCLVNGEGAAEDMIERQEFGAFAEAGSAFLKWP